MDSPFLSGPPEVTLIDATDKPYDTAVAAARTCYSANGIVLPDQVSGTRKARTVRDRIASSTLTAGHLTTRQHATFIFGIDKVSRAAVWSFLHGHPFYNSEQVSQRYVEVQPGTYVVPKLEPHADAVYGATVQMQIEAYQLLIKLLGPTIRDEFHALFPARANRPDRWERFLERKAYEIARYVLPIATYTHLYHTVSALTLMRYARMRDYIDFPAETALLVNAMLDAVLEIDPDFERELDDPFPLEETPEYAFIASRSDVVGAAAAHHQEFDNELGGLPSLLIDYPANAQETLAKAVRSVLGESSASLSTEDAIALVLNPAKNPHLADMLGPTTMSKLTRALAVVTYVFQKKLSHTADSQDQRHRMVPSTAPVLAATYTGIPDVVMPTLIGMNERAQELFERVIKQTTEGINKLLEMGVPTEFALYLLPNAHAVRKVSSGTLANLLPKGRQRLCYAAQEEIFHAMAAEAAQVTAKHPAIGQWLHAPCRLRQQASETPYCPEGTRFCGVPVWKLDVHEFDRVL